MEGSPHVVLSTGVVIKQEIFADECIVLKEEFDPDDSHCSNKFFPSSEIHTIIKEEIDADVVNIPAEQLHSSNIRKTTDTTGQCRLEDHLADVTCMSSVDPVVSDEQESFGKTRRDVTCDKCCKIYPNLITLKSHKLLQCGIQQYQCGVCKTSFSQPTSLSSHKLIHSDIRNKSNASDTYEEYLALEHQLAAHAVGHSNIENYVCDICNKVFTTKWNLNGHKERHIVLRKHICDICNKAFKTSSDLSRHKERHSDIKKYVCNVCNKAFFAKQNLIVHKERHIGVRKHICDICNKAFKTSRELKAHKERHSDIKKYVCNICNKAFSTSGDLSVHKAIHNIKMHICNICNKAFTTARNLHRHKVNHSGIKKIECDYCKKTFTLKRNLLKHILNIHNNAK